jgi:hypothetical protein
MLRLRLVPVLMLGILCTALPASAQNAAPTFELSAGYQFTHVPEENLPLGFAIDGSRNWGPLGLVGEIGWAHKSDDSIGFDTNFNLWHFAAGPRWSSHRSPAVTPYAQVLAGVATLRTSVEAAGVDISGSETKFMVQPGGGISVRAGDGWAVFGSVDYRRVFVGEEDGGGENEYRFLFGVRMQLE